jgi:hypothetical protein
VRTQGRSGVGFLLRCLLQHLAKYLVATAQQFFFEVAEVLISGTSRIVDPLGQSKQQRFRLCWQKRCQRVGGGAVLKSNFQGRCHAPQRNWLPTLQKLICALQWGESGRGLHPFYAIVETPAGQAIAPKFNGSASSMGRKERGNCSFTPARGEDGEPARKRL